MPPLSDLTRDSLPRRLAIALLRVILWGAYRLMARMRVEGAKNVPRQGAVMVPLLSLAAHALRLYLRPVEHTRREFAGRER